MTYRQGSTWINLSSRELYRKVAATAKALQIWGIAKGDRVAILSENRPEWAIADYAALAIGAVVVPIYTTLTPDQVAFLLRDSGTRVIFLSSRPQLKTEKPVRDKLRLERSVLMEDV